MTSKKDAPAAEVAIPDDPAAAVDPTYDTGIAAWLDKEREDTPTDEVATYREIVQQILASRSVFDTLMPPDVLSVRDVWGRDFALLDVRFNESEFDAGSPVYASMDVVWRDGEKRDVVNCGHQRMVAQLLTLHNFGVFPLLCTIERSNKVNRHGSYMYWLKFAEGGAEAARELGAKEAPPIKVFATRSDA
jgi:hypothetical protein